MEAGNVGPAPQAAPSTPTPPGAPIGWGIANPIAVGVAGFALTTFILGMVNANIISGGDTLAVLSVAGAYGGLVQLLAGMWAFRAGNTFAATAMSGYGGFWISFVLLVQFFLPEVTKTAGAAAAGHVVAIYLFCWGFFTFYLWIASFKTNVAVFLVFLTLWVAYGLLGWGDLNGGHYVIKDIGGAVTIACAVLAWYLAAAEVINETWGRTVVPLGPLNK